MAEVNARIASGEYRMEHDSCCCGEHDSKIIAQVDRYGIKLDTVLCKSCGSLRFDPYLSSESLAHFYQVFYQDMYARALEPNAYFVKQQQYGERLLRFVKGRSLSGKIIVEVGCGAGGALSVFKAAGCETYGCDYSERLVELGASRGLENLYCGDIETLIDGMVASGKKADLIFLHHVFEHLPAPVSWLVRARKILNENGLIVVAVPDVLGINQYPSPDGDLRLFLHVAHKFNFTVQGLSALAERANFSASLVDVEKSKQAPELWAAFSSAEHAAPVPKVAAIDTGEHLFSHLRTVEKLFVQRSVLRKLKRYGSLFVSAFTNRLFQSDKLP